MITNTTIALIAGAVLITPIVVVIVAMWVYEIRHYLNL